MSGPLPQELPSPANATRLRIIFTILILVAATTAIAGIWAWKAAFATHPGGDHLVAVGPSNPVTNFPEWYEDSTGRQLKLCINDPDLCIAAPVDPLNQLSVDTGFGDEAFWFSANASTPVGDGGTARLIMAVRAGYFNEVPTAGDQMALGRIRISATGLEEGGTYKVIHPYGEQTFVVAAGRTDIDDDTRVGCLEEDPEAGVCDFSLVLGSNIGPFLIWDPAVAPAAPPGAIGDPAVPHQVAGSPFNTNYFRIEGPNAGGPGVNFVQTNLFLVQGKMFDNAPVALDDTASVPVGASGRTINVLANDRDRDGDSLSITAVTQPASGSVAIGPGGTNLIFTPGIAGSAVFQYTVTSTMPGNPPQTDTALVTVGVHAVNAAPVAGNDVAQVLPNSLTNHIVILANDSDADGDLLNVSAVIQPANGSVNIDPLASHAIYRPNAAFSGTDVFTYTLSDGLATATGIVTVTVDTAPVPVTDTVRIYMNSANNMFMVLDNDSDPDGDVLTVTAVSAPSSGMAQVGPLGGCVIYTPAADFEGTATFTYAATGKVLSANATVVVTIGKQLIFVPVISR